MQKNKLALLLFLLAFKVLDAQELVFKNIGINQGLPSSEVYRVIQDKSGIVWMSTDAGVCRFNGKSIKCYTTTDGLPDNTVFDITEDASGRIWMNCFNGTICYLEKGIIHIPPVALELKAKLKTNNALISSLQFDEEQNLWIGTTDKLYSLSKKSNYRSLKNEKLFNDSVAFALKLLNNGKTVESINSFRPDLFLEFQKLNKIYFQFNQQNKNSRMYSFVSENALNPKFFSAYLKDKRLLVSLRNSLAEIAVNGDITMHTFPKTIISIQQDWYGNIWVGLARGGVYFFKEGKLNKQAKIYLENYSISQMLFDSEKGIWLSTFEKGIFYAPFHNYYTFSNYQELTTSIAGIGTYGSTVYSISSGNYLYSINEKNEVQALNADRETNLNTQSNFLPVNGQLAISGAKLQLFDTLSHRFSFISDSANKSFYANSVGLDENNTISFVAQGAYYVTKDLKVKQKLSLPARATSLYKTFDNKIYVGTLSGLFIKHNNKFEVVDHPVLAYERVNHIAGNAKRLYVATKNKGLFICEKNKWTCLDRSNGLPADVCNFVLVDESDTIWLATNKGVFFFNAENPQKIRSISTGNGLPTNEIGSLARRGNQLFIASKEGLCFIDLTKDYLNLQVPRIFITKVWESKSAAPILNQSVLKSNQNNISFYIECPTFKTMFTTNYTYVLKGYSDSIHFSDKEILEFQNLEPGAYTLEVKGLNSNSMVSQPATFSFTIDAPFWKNAWLIFFEIVCAASILYSLVLWRINKIRKQEKLKTEMNAMIVESRMAALQAQMNPHFIFNAINSIQSFVLDNETQNAYDYLAKFAKLVRLVLNNSKHNSIKLQTEIETLKLYVQMEQIRFRNSFDFSVSVDKNMDDISEISIPVMLIQPFIENAIWHGIVPIQEKRKGIIELRFSQDENFMLVEIEDNGIGREEARKSKREGNHKSLGMQLVSERIALIETKGKFKASMRITDLYTSDKVASGTLIKIHLPHTY